MAEFSGDLQIVQTKKKTGLFIDYTTIIVLFYAEKQLLKRPNSSEKEKRILKRGENGQPWAFSKDYSKLVKNSLF